MPQAPQPSSLFMAAAAVKPKYETLIDQYFAQNKGKVPDDKLMQNAVAAAQVAYSALPAEWATIEGIAWAYALQKSMDAFKPASVLLKTADLLANIKSPPLPTAEEIFESIKPKTCFKCAQVSQMLLCGKCGYASYCNRNCQLADWQSHKSICQLVVLANVAASCSSTAKN